MSVGGIDYNHQPLLASLKPLIAINTYFYMSLGLLIAINGYFQELLEVLIQVSLSTKYKIHC